MIYLVAGVNVYCKICIVLLEKITVWKIVKNKTVNCRDFLLSIKVQNQEKVVVAFYILDHCWSRLPVCDRFRDWSLLMHCPEQQTINILGITVSCHCVGFCPFFVLWMRCTQVVCCVFINVFCFVFINFIVILSMSIISLCQYGYLMSTIPSRYDR